LQAGALKAGKSNQAAELRFPGANPHPENHQWSCFDRFDEESSCSIKD